MTVRLVSPVKPCARVIGRCVAMLLLAGTGACGSGGAGPGPGIVPISAPPPPLAAPVVDVSFVKVTVAAGVNFEHQIAVTTPGQRFYGQQAVPERRRTDFRRRD